MMDVPYLILWIFLMFVKIFHVLQKNSKYNPNLGQLPLFKT